MFFLIKLTENDKRIIIALLIILILVFVLIGYLGMLIKRIMVFQAHRADTFMYDLVITKVVENPHHFRKVGRKKNWRLLFKQSWIPFLILLVSAAFLITYMGISGNWNLDVFDYGVGSVGGEGFTTLFFIFDFANAPRSDFFGISLVSGWPPILSNPHLSATAWPSYVFVPLFLVGSLWYLVNVQAFIARSYRILIQSKKVFEKRLDNYDATKNPLDPPLPNV